jgi:periplasmic divalent cation tolerance protein
VRRLSASFIIVIVTASSKLEAEKISNVLLEERLIACANIIGPVCSLFYWLGKKETVDEFMIFMKTRSDLFERLSERVKSLHSYEVPEILAIPVTVGLKSYLDWLGNALT